MVNARQRVKLLAMIGEEAKERDVKGKKKSADDSDTELEEISDESEGE